MKKTKYVAKFSVRGYLLFLVPLSITVGFSVIIYGSLLENNASTMVTAIFMLIYILVVTFLFCLIDIIRRKIMVEDPTSQILEATERIAKGEFDFKLIPTHSYYKYDEYDKIMENINRMSEELSKSEIHKTEFISNFSHEVKTPLATISSYVQALKKEGVNEDTKKKYLDVIYVTTEKLSNLITNILKLTKLEHQNVISREERLNAGELLRECILQYESLLDRKNIVLSCDIVDAEVFANKTYIEIIFNNLVSNAIKFTGEGGKIIVSLLVDGKELIFKVEDNGIGMTKEVGTHIFEKFYQADTSHASKGNGLGLSLVKKVIDIMGGEILVESELNKGSEFVVKLKRNL